MNIQVHEVLKMEGYLHLKSGHCYKGEWLNTPPQNEVAGEIVFFTGMTGYQEVLTDPSYKDQIIVFTYPLIGNYGVNESDFESKKPHVAGVIVYEGTNQPSHYQSAYTLKEYLCKWNIPVLGHMDTRSIVKKIRAVGSMPATMSAHSVKDTTWSKQEDHKVEMVSNPQMHTYGEGDKYIVLYDFGYKKSILNSLLQQNCKVTTVPFSTTFNEVAKLNPDGILLSNGPGDPKTLQHVLPELKKVITSYPTLGICLGHQLAALALGGNTTKLSFGHRGANHPISDLKTGRVMMSSQNHSYVVDTVSLETTGFKTRFINLHDQSVEGLTHEIYPIETVQFHPEANPGPTDTHYLFLEFIQTIEEKKGSVIAYA